MGIFLVTVPFFARTTCPLPLATTFHLTTAESIARGFETSDCMGPPITVKTSVKEGCVETDDVMYYKEKGGACTQCIGK